jgi:hypothetical protein
MPGAWHRQWKINASVHSPPQKHSQIILLYLTISINKHQVAASSEKVRKTALALLYEGQQKRGETRVKLHNIYQTKHKSINIPQ